MSIINEFTKALELVRRYENYKLMRAWGAILIITGIGRFLLSWILDQTLLFSLNWDFEAVAATIRVLRILVEGTLVGSIALITLYSFLSLKKTTLKEGGKLISSRDLFFGAALVLLFFLTFIIRIIGSVYFEEVLAVILCYYLLQKVMNQKIKEMYYLGIVLLIISLVELLGRIIIVVTLLYQPLFIPIWTTFYILIAIAFMIPYLVAGRKIWMNAPRILKNLEA